MTNLQCDVLVVGAGTAGICAAIAAARRGARVILLNDRSVPGGNASSEINVGITSANHSDGKYRISLNAGVYVKESGIVDELRQRALLYNRDGGYGREALWDAVFFDAIYEEPNIRLMLNTSVCGCDTENGVITTVYARNLNSSEDYAIAAPVSIDATGHAVLADFAGADYTFGREAKSEYGEKWAPEVSDRHTMGNTFLFHTEDVGHEVKFHAPKFAYDIRKLGLLERDGFRNPKCFRSLSSRGADWTYEYGGQVDTIRDTEAIDLELRKLTFGIWDYVKNSGKYPDAKNRVLCKVDTRAGTRESRRVLGDYVLTENDVENKVDFPDSVCHGGWPMDVHACEGIYDQAPASNFIPVTGPYNIPFRSLYSRNIKNLLLAGRDISVTHIALGSTRVQGTTSVIGQAVGTAAAMCAREKKLPHELLENISKLQQELLDDDQMIYFRKDSDMSDFTASATSEREYCCEQGDGFLPLEWDMGLGLMLETERLDSFQVYVKNSAASPALLRYRVFTGEHPETFLPSIPLCEREISIPATHDGWITVPVKAAHGTDKKLYIVFLENPDLALGCCSGRCPGAITMRMYTGEKHDLMNHDSTPLEPGKCGYIGMDFYCYHYQNILFRALSPRQELFSADKAINGYPRPFGTMNLWMPSGALPQTLTLRTSKQVYAEKIAVCFDNALEYDHFQKMPDCFVRRFTLTAVTNGGEKTYTEDMCWKRQNVFPVQGMVSEIRVTIMETYGKEAPGIYSVRLLK